MTRHKLLGVNVDILDEEEMYERILEISDIDRCSQIILLDTTLLMKAKFNKELFNLINSSGLVIPVSKGIRRGLSFISKKKCTVIHPYKFTIHLLSHFTEHNKIVYMIGGTKKVIVKTEKNIKDSFPGIKLMGSHQAHFKKEFEKKLITSIQKISPALLIVSMSRPKEEKWINRNKINFKRGVALGVEGFTDYVGEKMLSPYDRLFHTIGKKITAFFKKPVKFFTNILFVLYLLGYKLFRLEKV